MPSPGLMAGIFVGGESRRMGGFPKGRLRGPSGATLIERWQVVFSELGLSCVLVGRRPEYADVAAEVIEDELPGIGPLGGLIALLRAAGDGAAIAVACDMPYVDAALLRRLIAHGDGAAAVAPRGPRGWEPMLARYDAARTLPIALAHAHRGVLSLQGLLDALPAEELALTEAERASLRDWDSPRDMERS